MRTLAESALGAVLFVAMTACHKVAPVEATGEAGADRAVEAPAERIAEEEAGVSATGPRIAPARCRPSDPAIAVDADGDADADAAPDDLEIGDAIEAPAGMPARTPSGTPTRTPTRTVVSLLHRTARGLEAAVGFVSTGDESHGAKSFDVIDLGPTLGDAPPPRVILAGGDLIAGAYSIAPDAVAANGNAKARHLSLYDVSPTGEAKVILDVPQQHDDSLAFDLALVGAGFAHPAPPPAGAPSGPPARSSVVVIWDEASRAGHGVIRAMTLPLGDRTSFSAAPSPSALASAASAHDVSPPESDAEAPRLVRYGAGSIVLWIARKPEPGVPTDAAEVEATGEARSFGWLESVALDERGILAGPVRKLTPASGHVSAYDVRTLPAAERPTLLVVARDDGEGVDGSGGELLRVRIAGDAVEPPVAFPSDGLGRGGPALVDGDPPWLVWIGPHEQLRLLPLDAEGAPAGKPSAEDEMSEARPLAFLRDAVRGAAAAAGASGDPSAGGARRVLVASPLDPAAQLRVFACTP
jgi:hypothetical protein